MAIGVWFLERDGRLLSRRKGPCRSQACLQDWKPLSPSLDPCCSLFISASLNEFITLWGSALPKCNVLPPLSVRRASIESTFIILTFRRSFFSEPLCRLLCFPADWGDEFFFHLPFKVLFQGADKKASSRGILNENKNQLGHGLVKIWGRRRVKIREKKGALRWLERRWKAHTNQICSGVVVKIMVLRF